MESGVKPLGARDRSMEKSGFKPLARDRSMEPGVFAKPEESSVTMSEYEERRRKSRRWKLFILLLLVVVIIVVILALTVFKLKEPRVQINAIDLETLRISEDSLSLSLLLDVTVYNLNRASFRYSEGVTKLVYYGAPVGQALIPAGHIESRGEEYLSVLLFLESAAVLVNEHLAGNIVSGWLPVAAITTLSGTVSALGLFHHHVVSVSDCEISVFLANATLESFYCRHAVKLAR